MPVDKKALIDAASKMTIKPVTVDGLDGAYYVRGMTGSERDSFDMETHRNMQAGKEAAENFRTRLLVRVLCDEDGERMFEDSERAVLDRFSADVIEQLFEPAADLNRSIMDGGDEGEQEKN